MYGSFCNLCGLAHGSSAGVTYLRYTVLTRPKKAETAVHCCDPVLSVLVVLVPRNVLPRNVFHVLSALQPICFIHIFFLADQISCRSYVCSVYRMRSLAFSYSYQTPFRRIAVLIAARASVRLKGEPVADLGSRDPHILGNKRINDRREKRQQGK